MALFADRYGPVFDRQTDVLRVGERKDPTARWILLPVFAWRVLAPTPRPRQLNVFQRAILGLARAGVVRVHAVADRLLLTPDLVGVVVAELQSMGMAEVTGEPTKRGLDALEEVAPIDADALVVGHVLTHATDGTIWPRFIEGDLPLAEVESDADGWPVMVSGSTGDPWRDRSFCALPGNEPVVATRPTPADVLGAVRHHRRWQKRLEDVPEVYAPLLSRIEFIDDEPAPYLMAVCARPHPSGDWYVVDPFGPGEDPLLRERVDALLETRSGLWRWLGSLVGGPDDTDEPGHLQHRAEWIVDERLARALHDHRILRSRLVAMQRAHLEAELPGAPKDKRDDVLLKAQKVVERALRQVHERRADHDPPLFCELDRDVRTSRQQVDRSAAELGFETPLPNRLRCVRRGKVQWTEQTGRGSLRPWLILTLLAARWDLDHPLRCAVGARPSLLVDLDALAAARDQAGHDADESISLEQIAAHIETAFVAVEILLRPTPEGTLHGPA